MNNYRPWLITLLLSLSVVHGCTEPLTAEGAIALIDEGKEDAGVSALEELAQNDDFHAQTWLGIHYIQASPPDYTKGAKLLRQASEQGVTDATYYLATLYEYGNGVPENKVIAMELYQKASEASHFRATENLAMIYETGSAREGLVKSREMVEVARELWLDLFRYGAAGAAEWLARSYNELPPQRPEIGNLMREVAIQASFISDRAAGKEVQAPPPLPNDPELRAATIKMVELLGTQRSVSLTMDNKLHQKTVRSYYQPSGMLNPHVVE